MNPQVVIQWVWGKHDVDEIISSMKIKTSGTIAGINPPVFPNEKIHISKHLWINEFKNFKYTERDDFIRIIENSFLYVGVKYAGNGRDEIFISTSCVCLRHSLTVDTIEWFDLTSLRSECTRLIPARISLEILYARQILPQSCRPLTQSDRVHCGDFILLDLKIGKNR
jgi:hypothetical protein